MSSASKIRRRVTDWDEGRHRARPDQPWRRGRVYTVTLECGHTANLRGNSLRPPKTTRCYQCEAT